MVPRGGPHHISTPGPGFSLDGPEDIVIFVAGRGWTTELFTLDTVSPSNRHTCDVSTKVNRPGAKPQKLAPLLVTRFGVVPRV